VPQLGVEVVLALIGAASPPFALQPTGNPGDTLEFTRYFVVGNGTVSAITDARNEIECLPTGRVEGVVTVGGTPVANADIAVYGNVAEGPDLGALSHNIVTHTHTDSLGAYSFTLPAGNYNLVANDDGAPYEGGLSTPTQHSLAVTAFGTNTQNIALPATGALQVLVTDENSDPIAAKVSVVGFDPSPDPLNHQTVLIVNNTTGVFGERFEDGLPYGVAQTIFIGPTGDSGVLPLEPGDYRVVVSHGPEYSIDPIDVTITAGATQVVNAKVEHVIDSSGFISGDFHVHSIESPDAEVTHTERVTTMLAEGVDLFATTDHDHIVDFQSTIDDLGADSLISTVPGEEITTFDYGHFNAWPLTVDPNLVNGGAVDHGGAAPDGQDFPSYGNYSLSPAQIIAAAHALPDNGTVQINHIHSFFGLDGGSGLAVDTGVEPPQSGVPPAARRLDPSLTNLFSDTFDALEIWIGDNRDQIYNNLLGTVPTGAGGNIGDWFNLINQGIVRTAVADSDTHNRIKNVAGFPRTMVASPTDDPGSLRAIASTLSASVNSGHAFGTNAPMVRVTASATSTGQTGGLGYGQPTTIATTDGDVDLTVDVQSPTWAEFDRIEYYINPATTRRTLMNLQTGAGPINVNRYSITPDEVQNAGSEFTVNTVPVAGTSSSRLQATATLHLTGLTEDTWVVILVRGTDGISHPMFPVLPNDLKQATNTTLADLNDGNLGEDGITALAFTNPIFIDADGVPGWMAPGVQVDP
jgi:hypothetical protein